MSEPIPLRVPKSMPAEHVVWAFRYGVAWARQSVLGDNSAVRRHSLGFVAAPRNVLRLAGRVQREAMRRLIERRAAQPTDSTDPCPEWNCPDLSAEQVHGWSGHVLPSRRSSSTEGGPGHG